jgi:hypothetical protein
MAFWDRQMPKGMLLRSSWDASHISDPARRLTLDAYQHAIGERLPTPVPLDRFVAYGRWFQQRVAPDLDERRVTCIDVAAPGFRLTLEDGESLNAERLVIATGIAKFAHRPALFDGLPGSRVSHASQHRDLSCFSGRDVAVIGGGQSALESAALLGEAGAAVEVMVRAPRVRWLTRSGRLHRVSGAFGRLLYHPTDVGPPVLNQLVARPELFRRLPRPVQDRLAYRSIRPAGSGWLVPRLAGVQITTSRQVVAAELAGERLHLTLDDGGSRTVDHVLLATGYRVDVSGYGFFTPLLLANLARANGYPRLGAGLEASIPGLHFLGATAAWSFGPLMRFVSGSAFAASALTRSIVQPTRAFGRPDQAVGQPARVAW